MQAFNLDAPQQLEEKGIEAAVLFGNIGEIIEISDRFLEIGFHWGKGGSLRDHRVSLGFS